jgi:hypothetical protein
MSKKQSNKKILQRGNKIRLWQENVPKTDVEQTKGNGKFYFYFYLSRT